MILRRPAEQPANPLPADRIEPRMNKLTKAILTLWLLGGLTFPIVVAFFAWQRGLGSTH